MPDQLKYLGYGVVIAAGALLGAWLLNAVFERSWEAIALILLAMVLVVLVQRITDGGIPAKAIHPENKPPPASIEAETAGLPGIDPRYGWMAIPSALAFLAVLVSLLV